MMLVPPRLRRWFRFSLRTLLVLTTLVCVWLGLQVNRASRQRRAIEKLEGLDAYTACYFAEDIGESDSDSYDPFRPGDYPTLEEVADPLAPEWLLRLLGEDYFRTLVGVHLQDDEIGFTPSLQAIVGLSSIERVDLVGGDLLGKDVRLLATLPNLRTLNCSCSVTGEALSELAKLKRLEVLSLGETHADFRPALAQLVYLRRLEAPPFLEPGMQDIGRLQRLEHLVLGHARITKQALDTLGSLKSLKRLELPNATFEDVTDYPDFPQLERLDLTGSNIDDRRLQRIGSMPAIDKSRTNVIDPQRAQVAHLPRLRWLKLDRTQVQGSGLAALAVCPLERLELSNCPLSADQLSSLGQLRSLRELVLGDYMGDAMMDFGDRELAIVAQLPNLEMLDLRKTKATPKGLEILTHAARLERLGLPVSVALAGLPWLQKMPRLKHLKVDSTIPQTMPILKSKLPQCTISQTIYFWSSDMEPQL